MMRLALTLLAPLLFVAPPAFADASLASAPSAVAPERAAIAREAYAYLYPLVIMDITRRQQTERRSAGGTDIAAPVNSFHHNQSFPPGDFRAVVRPNFDTLYSSAWLDLAKEPILLSIGETKGRYFLLPLYDMWTDVFADPGSETLPPQGGTLAITAPGWRGTLPAGVERVESPTRYVWIIGRVQTNGAADYPAVHTIQKSFTLTPLSRYGQPDTPAVTAAPAAAPDVDLATPPLTLVNRMSPAEFYDTALRLMADNPPHANDQPELARLRLIGITPGAGFSFAALPAEVQAALADAKQQGPARLGHYRQQTGQQRGPWRVVTTSIGSYGADYEQRAAIAMYGLGANRPSDAIYPAASTDSAGQPLTGANRYVIHFRAGELPPVRAFWSLTAYDSQGFTTPNAINRYALGDRDPLTLNPDGSLDLYLQTEDPGPARRANWLPIPAGVVNLSLRLYLPKDAAMNGDWPLPVIERKAL